MELFVQVEGVVKEEPLGQQLGMAGRGAADLLRKRLREGEEPALAAAAAHPAVGSEGLPSASAGGLPAILLCALYSSSTCIEIGVCGHLPCIHPAYALRQQ